MADKENTNKNDTGFTHYWRKVTEEERKHIFGDDNTKNDLTGFAISGGGIRSASFGLGVMQALASKEARILEKIDYLSTVSGGGYIGSSLTWFLKKGLPDDKPAGTQPDNFPFGSKGEGSKESGKRNAILDFIRQHGNYLNPGYGINIISLIAVVLRSMFVSLFVYLSLITVLMIGLIKVGLFQDWRTIIFDAVNIIKNLNLNPLIWTSIDIALLLLLLSLLFSLRTGWSGKSYKGLIRSQWRFGWGLSLLVGFIIVGSIQYAGAHFDSIWSQLLSGSGLVSIGTIIGFFQMRPENSSKQEGKSSKLVIIVGVIALIYGLLLLGYIFAQKFIGLADPNLWLWYGVLALATIVFGGVTNLNYCGLHRMYRDRLMELFQPNLKNVISGHWGAATDADHALIENMCADENKRPYHLINANIVLVDSDKSKYRGRGGDSFLLSPLYCGSDATGWRKTRNYMKSYMSRGMTLPTAMAISGAAVNPNTGVGGKGVTRNRLVSTLMSLLNIRLGYWASNPDPAKSRFHLPNFFSPGLWQGVFGGGLKESKKFIELSDGGHFENLALYELIRRKTKVIIVSDGGADPKYTFSDLANAVERVRVDFGALIKFDVEKPKTDDGKNKNDVEKLGLKNLLPGSAGEGDYIKKYGLAKRGYAVADIEYLPETDGTVAKGTLFYIKTTLIPGLPEDIYGYKSAHPTFPDQTTADQFFDEGQFEAYRELGYRITKRMITEVKILDCPGIQLLFDTN